MEIQRFATPVVLASTFVLACCGGSGGGPSPRQRSSTLMVAAVPGGAYAAATPVAVPGGTLDLQVAVFSLDRVVIEENTGESGGGNSQGGGENEEDSGSGENESGSEREPDSEDIVLAGPFVIDIATGGAVLGSTSVYPGTFAKADLTFRLAAEPPLSGDSIFVTGTYHAGAGAGVPFTLASRFDQPIQVALAAGGITVAANAVVPIALTFDLAAMFGDLDLATAVIEGGEIRIDESHNVALLGRFEANLAAFIELEDDDGD